MKYYAVKQGRTPGIYYSWEECKEQVEGFSNAKYKSFTSLEEANQYLDISTIKNQNRTNDCSIYVDGSYDKKTKRYSYGMVVLINDQEICFNESFLDEDSSMHNVAGEIKGAIKAFDYCLKQGITNLKLYYDYEGIEKWALEKWRANKKATKEYQAYFKEINKKLQVEFIKIKSHTNNHYNDLADQLAKEALR